MAEPGIYLKTEEGLIPGATVPGPVGETGPGATVSVGSVITGAAGTNASVINTGTPEAAVLSFTIPKGDTGLQGIQGPKGDKGDPGAGNVDSVNGQLGPDIVLTAADVGAQPTIAAGTTSQYYRGDKTWQTLDKAAVGLSLINNVAQVEIAGTQTITGTKSFTATISGPSVVLNGVVSTASSGGITLRAGLIKSVPSNSTDAYIGVHDTGGPGGLSGDILLIPRTSTGVANAIRMFTGQTTPVERVVIDTSGLLIAKAGLSVTGTATATTFSGSGSGLTGLTKSMVGLSNVDNTSDVSKPISAPQSDYVKSRGMNLVTNGTAYLKNNTNFTSFTYWPTDRPVGSGGSFKAPANSGSPQITEIIPIDPAKRFKFQWQMKQLNASNTTGAAYGMLIPYDIDGLGIMPQMYMYRAGTTTQLSQALSPGDTVMYLTDSAGNWNNAAGASTHWRNIVIWNWVDGTGYAWPKETYSRNVLSNAYNDGGINVAGQSITLSSAYSGPALPAGTWVSNGGSGGNYMYTADNNFIVPRAWTTYSDEFGGIHAPADPLTAATKSFPVGTAFVKVGWLTNRTQGSPYNDPTSEHAVANVSFSEITAGNLSLGTIGDSLIATANKDGAVAVPSMRTLGTGANQAAAGNHTHDAAGIISGTLAIARLPVATSGTSNTTQVVRADDSRLSNARTPLAHTHVKADITDFAHTHAQADITGLTTALDGKVNNSALAVANGVATLDANTKIPIVLIPTGNTSTTVVVGNDPRLSDARTPTAHTHAAGDITSGVIATARLGSGTADTTTFLRGDNTWAIVSTGANLARVIHDGTNYPARPDVDYVEWVGPVEPTAMVEGDSWVNTA